MEQELLYKYFKGTTSEEEERLILDWVVRFISPCHQMVYIFLLCL